MNILEQKIAEVFRKSEWRVRSLREILKEDIIQGIQEISNKCVSSGNFPSITAEDVVNSKISKNKCEMLVDESLTYNKILTDKGDLLIVVRGFPLNKLGTCCAYLGNQKCIAGNNLNVIKHSCNPKYLSYFFSSKYAKSQIKNLYTGGSARPYINKEDLLKINLLIPNLETQNKIVEFLDGFVSLERELKKEIEKRDRKKRYPIWVLQRANSQYRNF